MGKEGDSPLRYREATEARMTFVDQVDSFPLPGFDGACFPIRLLGHGASRRKKIGRSSLATDIRSYFFKINLGARKFCANAR